MNSSELVVLYDVFQPKKQKKVKLFLNTNEFFLSIPEGEYKIKTTAHEASGCPASLTLGVQSKYPGAERSSYSIWVGTQPRNYLWRIERGQEEGAYLITSKNSPPNHKKGKWSLNGVDRAGYDGVRGASTTSARTSIHKHNH